MKVHKAFSAQKKNTSFTIIAILAIFYYSAISVNTCFDKCAKAMGVGFT